METEIWKKHPEIEGMEVSTLGNVRVLDRLGSRENRTYSKKGRVLKQFDNGRGYMQVYFRVDGKRTMKYIHRLVAQTFIENNGNLPQINHRDCNQEIITSKIWNGVTIPITYNIGKSLGKHKINPFLQSI